MYVEMKNIYKKYGDFLEERHRLCVSELCAVSIHDNIRQCGVWAGASEDAEKAHKGACYKAS